MIFTVGPKALADYWAVYQVSMAEMNASALAAVQQDPWLGPLIAAMTPEIMEAQQAIGLERLRKGISGDWSDYVNALRADGARYAEVGIPFKSWYSLLAAINRSLMPRLVEAYGKDPERLSNALSASRELTDGAMAILTDTYLATKQSQIDTQQVRGDELERQNVLYQEASRLKSEFLANMSHELRTPLNAIIGFSELMRDGVAGPVTERQADFLEDVLTSGRHLLGLINDVLDLAKVEAGRLELHPEDMHLPVLAKEVLAVLRQNIARKKLVVETDFEPDFPMVRLDPGRVKQVLFNYLSNALKFTPEAGKITVRLRGLGPRAVRLEVVDTGPGIREQDLGKLFREFEQVGSAAQSAQGTGLGLALTRRLVEAMGGTVGVTSEVGRGSTFFAELPIRMAREVAPGSNVVLAGATEHAPRILVVEDDPQDQKVLVRILGEQGYAVETVSTMTQAFSRVNTQAYDAITLDLVLPDGPGLDVLRTIRKGTYNKHTPVIIVSVAAEERIALGYSVAGVVPKPISADALREALGAAGVGSSQARSIAVVDDDAVSLRLASECLGELGFKAACYTSPLVALENLAREPASAIILDLLMPELDGFAFLERLRRHPTTNTVPVFIWTVKDLSEDEQRRLRTFARTVVLDGKRSGSSLISELNSLLPAPTPAMKKAVGS